MATTTDKDFAVYQGATLVDDESKDGELVDGTPYHLISRRCFVRTEHGFVHAVASAYWVRGNGWRHRRSHLEILHDGRQYTRMIDGKAYSIQYLVTLAKRFASEVITGKLDEAQR